LGSLGLRRASACSPLPAFALMIKRPDDPSEYLALGLKPIRETGGSGSCSVYGQFPKGDTLHKPLRSSSRLPNTRYLSYIPCFRNPINSGIQIGTASAIKEHSTRALFWKAIMNAIEINPQLSEDGEASSRWAGSGCQPMHGRSHALESRWYAVRTHARHEKRVRDHLEARNIGVFLPLYEQVHRWKNGCRVRVELPLFPTYLFVEMDFRHRARVLEIPGAISFVGTSCGPSPVCEVQIQALRTSLHLRKCEPHAYLVVGQKVRIVTGPLASLTGILVRKNAALRVVLALDEIMQGVSVEVDADETEAVIPATGSLKPL
jgi:transcription antitermination factor NusG